MNLESFNTPILLIAWKRPEKTLKIISKIKLIKPKKIYIACDGPIEGDKNNLEKVNETRRILSENINWDCERKYLFSNYNQGCKYGVSNAIDWFFKNEKKGLILEDDCLPHLDFFYFCAELLDKYESDNRIWSITGQNMQGGKFYGESSYYFSKYSQCWGWATWRRCWERYDRELKSWPKYKKSNILSNLFENKKQINYWTKIFDKIYYESKPDTWDYQWTYTCLINSGLTIVPNKNLIKNIGFDDEATHTKENIFSDEIKDFNNLSSGLIPLKHPENIFKLKKADILTEANCYSIVSIFSLKGIAFILNKLKVKYKKYILNLIKIS